MVPTQINHSEQQLLYRPPNQPYLPQLQINLKMVDPTIGQKRQQCGALALTLAGIEQELSERALIAVSLQPPSFPSREDRSSILSQRVRLLELEVTCLLASLHFSSTSPPSAEALSKP